MSQPRRIENNRKDRSILLPGTFHIIKSLNTLPQSWKIQDGEKGEKWKRKNVELQSPPY